jgi:ABC-type transporter Mla subunit MlaD
MATDPIAPVVSALNVLVTVQNTSPYTPTDTALYATVGPLLTTLFHVSSDLTTVSKDINTALTDVVNVIKEIASVLNTLGSDAANVMQALQQGLSLAQTLAPGGASSALNSASQLFQTLQNLVSAVPIAQAATELGELGSQLTEIAKLFPTS